MKPTLRLLFTLLTLSIGLTLNGQIFWGNPMTPDERAKIRESREESWRKMQEKRVEAVTISAQAFKKGKAKHDLFVSTTQHINDNGQMVEMESFLRNGKLSFKLKYEYDTDGNPKSETTLSHKGKLRFKKEYEYKDNLLATTRNYHGQKGRHSSRTEFSYDTQGKLIASKSINPKNEKLRASTTCAYYEDGSKKRVEKFNRKGKLVSATDYSCDAVGKTIAAKKVEERIVCERYEQAANGATLKVVEIFIGDKGNYRSVSKYDTRNYLVEQTNYDEAGIIVMQWIYDYNDQGHLLTIQRNEKGGKLDYRSEYERNDKGLAVSEVCTNGKGEVTRKLQYSYSYY
jgi:hypothetical protein